MLHRLSKETKRRARKAAEATEKSKNKEVLRGTGDNIHAVEDPTVGQVDIS